jgi:polysaccharide pyruvyl transferase WcaK-like protein
MNRITIAITAASYHGNKGAAAMLQSAIGQLREKYGPALRVNLMSVYPRPDRVQAPRDCVKVVSCSPARAVFGIFPLAAMFRAARWLPSARPLCKRGNIINAYLESDLVIDMAGVSFVDSRGFIMNTYAAITIAIPLLLGIPVVKYSQALGSFKRPYNRLLAARVLPKIELICARGAITQRHLRDIGIHKNVILCADGAFSMADDPVIAREAAALCAGDSFYLQPFIALSLSSAVDMRCAKLGIGYRQTMEAFIKYLHAEGYGVLLIAHAARAGSDKPRNNDLPLCEAIYCAIADKNRLRWYNQEMPPEKIRELIGRSSMLVGSRFHAMIAALERAVPVLLIGWSHKYREVLDMFGLGAWAVDYTDLTGALLIETFQKALSRRAEIARMTGERLPAIRESSLDNIRSIAEIIGRNAQGKKL